MTKISRYMLPVAAILIVASMVARNGAHAATPAVAIPAPTVDDKLAAGKPETAVFAGGCFWGVQAVFQHVKGVVSATSGYSGGPALSAEYETVSTGQTGHAESVEVKYDPSKVSYGQLLQVFFSVAHDPTTLNRQGPDEGTQYRSVIFYNNDGQKKIADAYVAQLNAAKIFSGPIVTQITPMKGFYPAEAYHQDYARLHPHNPYIAINDAPKVDHLRQQLPDLYRDR